jgi:two-component system chemotaxis sensor kinase CheA
VTPHGDARVRLAVLGVGGKDFAVVVDGFGETAEVVVKPLTRAIRAIPLFSGVTLLSDGSPSLILDAEGLASIAGIVTPSRGEPEVLIMDKPVETSLLLAVTSGGGQVAVALAQIQRLEQFAPEQVERTGTTEVIYYGNQVLPLLRLGELLSADATRHRPINGGEINAIVCTSSAGLVGLVVERIDDVVIEPPALSQPVNRRGVSARLMINNRMTELVDIEALVTVTGLRWSA